MKLELKQKRKMVKKIQYRGYVIHIRVNLALEMFGEKEHKLTAYIVGLDYLKNQKIKIKEPFKGRLLIFEEVVKADIDDIITTYNSENGKILKDLGYE